MKAIDFNLPDQDGKYHKLSDYRGKWVILYFYPRDDTPICVKEACSFRDNLHELKAKNVVTLGVSGDSAESHQQFIHKYKLNFPLLSDESKEIIKQYNAWGKKVVADKEVIGILRRTYLINPEGEVAKFYEKVDPTDDAHTKEILTDLQKLQSK
jgi:peroxiredoxin Q/BCP